MKWKSSFAILKKHWSFKYTPVTYIHMHVVGYKQLWLKGHYNNKKLLKSGKIMIKYL